jgi:hypothetical protein
MENFRGSAISNIYQGEVKVIDIRPTGFQDDCHIELVVEYI